MKPAADDLKARQRVWEALSTLFLDTEVSADREWRAKQLAASCYSIEELESILSDEVFPVCRWNLLSTAGVWTGFDPDWLREAILGRLRRRSRFSLGMGRLLITRSDEWRKTRERVSVLRSQAM